jgi:type VI protein secretion system component VasF
LGIPRQGQGRKRVSLMPDQQNPRQSQRPLTHRLLWFAALWLAGVAAVTVLSLGLRLWLAPR